MSDNETYYYVRSTKFCFFSYMYVHLFYTFIRLMLLRLCSQHYFILVMNPVTFYNNNNNKSFHFHANEISQSYKTSKGALVNDLKQQFRHSKLTLLNDSKNRFSNEKFQCLK